MKGRAPDRALPVLSQTDKGGGGQTGSVLHADVERTCRLTWRHQSRTFSKRVRIERLENPTFLSGLLRPYDSQSLQPFILRAASLGLYSYTLSCHRVCVSFSSNVRIFLQVKCPRKQPWLLTTLFQLWPKSVQRLRVQIS